MKIIHLCLVVGLVCCSMGFVTSVGAQVGDQEYEKAVQWMHASGMTKYDDGISFRPNDYLTREQASKFFFELYSLDTEKYNITNPGSNELISIVPEEKLSVQEKEDFETMKEELADKAWFPCVFDDIANADSTLLSYITSSCEVGMLKGNKLIDGTYSFRPFAPMTKAEALTVLVRMLEGYQDESGNPWRGDYFERAQKLELTKETDVWALNKPVTRYEVSLLMYRAIHGYTPDPLEAELSELEQLFLSLM